MPDVSLNYSGSDYAAVLAPIDSVGLLSWINSTFTSIDGNYIAWTGNSAVGGNVYAGTSLVADPSWLTIGGTAGGLVDLAYTASNPGQYGMVLLGENYEGLGTTLGLMNASASSGIGWSLAELSPATPTSVPEPGNSITMAVMLSGALLLRQRRAAPRK
jgi:hypothetical protein